jgi:hypothetical protein
MSKPAVAKYTVRIEGDKWIARCAYCTAEVVASIYDEEGYKALLVAEHGAVHTR